MARRHLLGLTLIETAIAMAALALLVSLAMPPMLGYLQRQRLKALAQEMAADLSEARHEAARSGLTFHLHLRAGADWCYALSTSATCDCGQPAPCQAKAVRATQRPGLHLVEGRATRFEPTAPASPAFTAAVFTDAQGDRLRVDLNPTGRARVCAPDGVIPQIAAC